MILQGADGEEIIPRPGLWIRLASWHLLHLVGDEEVFTRCGRQLDDVPLATVPMAKDYLPLGEPSCETCLRLHERDDERQATAPADR